MIHLLLYGQWPEAKIYGLSLSTLNNPYHEKTNNVISK